GEDAQALDGVHAEQSARRALAFAPGLLVAGGEAGAERAQVEALAVVVGDPAHRDDARPRREPREHVAGGHAAVAPRHLHRARAACRDHGIGLAGKSSCNVTISSRGASRRPSATVSRPWEVLVVKATSVLRPPTSAAAARRAVSRRSSQSLNPAEPRSRASRRESATASSTGRA